MVKWCTNELKTIGFKTEVFKDYGNPLVYGHLIVDPSYPTILQYGHYDVQPAGKGEGWSSEPFKLTEKKASYSPEVPSITKVSF